MSVSVSTDKTQYSPNETVAISGRVLDGQNNTVLDAGISIQVNDPQNSLAHVQLVYSDQLGAYSDSFVLPASAPPGQYTIFVAASKAGYNTAQAQAQFSVLSQSVSTTSSSFLPSTFSSSSQATQTANPPKCFIATATYGSELAPEVALLRKFRDSEVLQTSAGRSFMGTFNAFYYSFSPWVASFIASHSYARAVMKIALYPLIAILYNSEALFKLLSFNSEFAIILSGIFAAFGIGIVYLGPMFVISSRLTKRSSLVGRTIAQRLILMSISISLTALSFAELSHFDLLLTVATVSTVLSFLALGGGILFAGKPVRRK